MEAGMRTANSSTECGRERLRRGPSIKGALNVAPTEALVAGKIQVIYNDEDVTQKIYLDYKNAAGTVFRIDQDPAGIFFARLPTGSYQLSLISFITYFHGGFMYPFEGGRAVFEVPQGGKIYDLGFIRLDWEGPGMKAGAYFGAIGALVDIARGNGVVGITATESPDVERALSGRFGSVSGISKISWKISNPAQ
jgi:hypothetical protein